MDCVKCGTEVSSRRVEVLAQWNKPVTCLQCAESSTPKYRLEAEHDAVREDAPVFVLVTAASYAYGNPARLGRQTATYQGGRP